MRTPRCRRRRIEGRVLALALAALSGCGGEAPPAVARNAVLICLDTVRADTFELARALRPSDGAATWQRAVSLARAQTPSPWTVPAVASALTGLDPRRHGAGMLPGPVADLRRTLPNALGAGSRTLAERLQTSGFETAGFYAHRWLRVIGLNRGFEVWQEFRGLDSRLRIEQAVEQWLSRRDTARPFFLYLHMMEAHRHPHLLPQERAARIAALGPEARARVQALAPGGVCSDPGAALCRQYLAYVGSVVVLQSTVARILDTLERRGELQRSAVVLFSDHGEEFLEHAQIEAEQALDPRAQYGLGHGHALFQELLHVPVRVWHPALRGGSSDAPASLVDIAPTLLDYLGVGAEALDGQSLRGALEGDAFDPERPLYAGTLAFGPQREAVLSGSWKAIGGAGLPHLFYDLARDPREGAPLADPGGFEALLARYRAQPRAAGDAWQIDAESAEALRAIGYLEQLEPAPD